uniref:Ig-like domain-containing protein n=1 Tax=Salarias fasciatus TaxID=181472 RepID=A0A672FR35_SALFA
MGNIYFLAAPLPPAACFKVMEGGVASLSCQYSVERFRLSRVCWGRGCGTFWCSNILVQTDEHGVVSKVEERYRLTGDVLDGQMDLDILNVRRTDSGPYCCRVDVDGIFNDKKVIMNLRVVKGEAPETHNRNDNNETQNRDEEKTQQPRLDSQRHTSVRLIQQPPPQQNSTLLHPDAVSLAAVRQRPHASARHRATAKKHRDEKTNRKTQND